jgi:hypothetical protein
MLKRKVRIKLAGLPAPLRAVARDLSEQGVMLEAELPWLKLGSAVTTEVAAGRERVGRLKWVGIDVAPSGAARLRVSVDFTPEGASGATPPVVEEAVQEVSHCDETEIVNLNTGRRFWPWVLFLGLAGAAAGGALWLDRMSQTRPLEGAELRVTDTLPKAEVPPAPGVVIPKAKPATPPPPRKHSKR